MLLVLRIGASEYPLPEKPELRMRRNARPGNLSGQPSKRIVRTVAFPRDGA
jgi:hypothetical protein